MIPILETDFSVVINVLMLELFYIPFAFNSLLSLSCRLILFRLPTLLWMLNLVWVEQVKIWCNSSVFITSISRNILSISLLFEIWMLFYYLVLIAGRSAKENLLFTEVTEGMNSYGVTRHRHGKFSLPNINGLDLCLLSLMNSSHL